MEKKFAKHAYFMVLCIWFYGIQSCSSTAKRERGPIAETHKGRVEGKYIQVKINRHTTKTISAFLGIPFAQPPINDLRFSSPVPMDPWRPEVLQTKQLGNSCFHMDDTVFPGFSGAEMWNSPNEKHEDCLYLNVWVPEKSDQKSSTDHYYQTQHLRAVMIWIYGGSFYSGTSSLSIYDGRYLAAAENVVIVSLNYRLGPLGFLPPLADSTPGNVGLLDQNMAIKWVKDNIRNFGGDPNKITLFGESAGAASIALHALSPLSKGLFQKIILQSGAHTTPWAAISKSVALERTRYLAGNLSCEESATASELSILACLRSKSAQEVFAKSWITSDIFDFPFVPVYETSFLPNHPLEMVTKGNFSDVDMMAGFNSNEGSYFTLYTIPGYSNETESLINSVQYEAGIKLSGLRTNSLGRSAASFMYKDWDFPNNPAQYRNALDNIVGDFHVVCPVIRAVKLQSTIFPSANVFLYHLSYRLSTNPWPLWMDVMHGYEIELVFGVPMFGNSSFPTNYTDDDRSVSRRMVRYWANFAKHGNPSARKADEGSIMRDWPRFNTSSQQYVEITLERDVVQSPSPEALFCAFWEKYIPSLEMITSNADELDAMWKIEFQKWKESMFSWETAFKSYTNNRHDCG